MLIRKKLKDELIGVNNNRNHLLACLGFCSNCKCFNNSSNVNYRLEFNKLCLKNKINDVINRIRLLFPEDFDKYFIFKTKEFKENCFVSKDKEELNL